jgi:hypothetical protein
MAETAPPPAPAARLPLVTPTRVVCAVLLAAPFVALLWVSSYSRLDPTLLGIPFFYWYQLVWVVVSALLTGSAYLLVRREERHRALPAAPAAPSTEEAAE